MLGFRPKLPVTADDREWVDHGFARLERLLGRSRMLHAKVVLPTAEYFPDPYDKTACAAEALFRRVCAYMSVDRRRIEFEVFPDETEELSKLVPSWNSSSGGCAGLYTHDASDDPAGTDGEKRMVIAVRNTQLQDPLTLVATLAHELGHVILLGGGLLDAATPDHEPLTDLLTVFLGMGIFTANSAALFQQYQDETRQGWSMRRLGYLPEEVFGYALAKFAAERGEDTPPWIRHLSTNVRAYYKRSRACLNREKPRPIG